MEQKQQYENGIPFDQNHDHLREQLSKSPFQYLTVEGLKAELMKALNANNNVEATLITKELQSRNHGEKPQAFGKNNLSVGENKRAPGLN